MTEDEHTPLIIDKVSNLLAYLLELKEKGKFQEAVDLIDETLQDYFDFDSHNANLISEDFIKEVAEDSRKLPPEVISRMGDLLNEKGELLYSQNKLQESKDILKNALTIYFYLNDSQDIFSFERMNKMVLINDRLSHIDLEISR